MRKWLYSLYLVALLLLALPMEAHAYLDPGTGSIILQALAAGAIAVGIFWRRIIDFFKKFFQKNKTTE